MRAVWFSLAAVLGVAGCGFHAGNAPGDGQTGPGDSPGPRDDGRSEPTDAKRPLDAKMFEDAKVYNDAPPGPPCHTALSDASHIMECLEFEDTFTSGSNGTAMDGSIHHHDAMVAPAYPTMRTSPTTSQAIEITTGDDQRADVYAADSTDFGVTTFTLMAWVDLTTAPTTGAFGIIYKSNQYSMGVSSAPSGAVDCYLDGQTSTAAYGSVLATGTWTLAVCTFDGTQVCANAIQPGHAAPAPGCTAVPTGFVMNTSDNNLPIVFGSRYDGGTGATTFDHFVGSIDEVHVYDEALTTQQICAEGGVTGC